MGLNDWLENLYEEIGRVYMITKDKELTLKILEVMVKNEATAHRKYLVKLFESVAGIVFFTSDDVLAKKEKLGILESIARIKACINHQEPLRQSQQQSDEN